MSDASVHIAAAGESINQSSSVPTSRTCDKCRERRSTGAFLDWSGKTVCKYCSLCRESDSIRKHWLGSGNLDSDGDYKAQCKASELHRIEVWTTLLEAAKIAVDGAELEKLKAMILKFDNPSATKSLTTTKSWPTLEDNDADHGEPLKGSSGPKEAKARIKPQSYLQTRKRASSDTTIELPETRKRQNRDGHDYDNDYKTFQQDKQDDPEFQSRPMPLQSRALTNQSGIITASTIAPATTPLHEFLKVAASSRDSSHNTDQAFSCQIMGLLTALEQASSILPRERYKEYEMCVEQARFRDSRDLRKLIKNAVTTHQAKTAAHKDEEAIRQAFLLYKKA